MESNHRQVAYETTALPLSYRDVILVPVRRIELLSEGYKSTVIPLYYTGIELIKFTLL